MLLAHGSWASPGRQSHTVPAEPPADAAAAGGVVVAAEEEWDDPEHPAAANAISTTAPPTRGVRRMGYSYHDPDASRGRGFYESVRCAPSWR
jgi:hypothetical protein